MEYKNQQWCQIKIEYYGKKVQPHAQQVLN